MRTKFFKQLSISIAAGVTLALSATESQGGVQIGVTATPPGPTTASATTAFSIDGSGNVSVVTAASGLTSSGSVTSALSFNTTFGFTIAAALTVNTTTGPDFGAKLTDGVITRTTSNPPGAIGVAATAIQSGFNPGEGMVIGIDATNLPTTLAWKLTGIRLSAVDATDGYTIVNRNGTCKSVTGAGFVTNPVNLSSLDILVPGGTSDLDLATIYMSAGASSTANFRITGFDLDVVPANYASWANRHGILCEPASGDHDKDGLPNLAEYALGKDPKVSDPPAGLLAGNTITFTKGTEAIANGDVSWVIETSTDLGLTDDWTPAVTQPAGDPALTISHNFTPSTPVRDFARLKVTQVP